MNAIEARAATQKAEQQKKLDAAHEAAKRETEEQQRRIKHLASVDTFYVPAIQKEIKKAADQGSNEIIYTLGMESDNEFKSRLVTAFEKLGFEAKVDGEYRKYERGDPESGEGEVSAGWYYWLVIKW